MVWFKLSTLYSLLVGVVYAIHSIGLPVASFTVKPYQFVSILGCYRAWGSKLIIIMLCTLVIHAVLVYFSEGYVAYDISAYVFVVMLLIYSYIAMHELEVKFRFVLAGTSAVYLIGVVIYAYAVISGDYVNIHKDVDTRSELVNSVASFVFYDGNRFRYNGYALDPNFYAFYLNMLFGISVFFSYTRNLKLPRIFVLMTAISILLTLSRVGVVSFLILFVAWGWVGSGHVKRLGVFLGMFAVVLGIGALGLYMGRSLFSYQDAGDSRLWVWYYHINNALAGDHAFLGHGLTFDIVRYIEDEVFHKSTHNTVLYLLYCLGLPFTLLLVLLWLIRFAILVFNIAKDRSVILLAIHLVYALSIVTLDLVFTIPFYLYMFFCFRYPVKRSMNH